MGVYCSHINEDKSGKQGYCLCNPLNVRDKSLNIVDLMIQFPKAHIYTFPSLIFVISYLGIYRVNDNYFYELALYNFLISSMFNSKWKGRGSEINTARLIFELTLDSFLYFWGATLFYRSSLQ